MTRSARLPEKVQHETNDPDADCVHNENEEAEFGVYELIVAALLCVALSGCVVGPHYNRPAASTPTAPNYKESPVNFQDAEGWKVASPQDAMLHGNWWEIFNQPELNDLEKQLNIDNQNIKVFFENYLAARALIREAHAQYYPTVSVGASVTRSSSSGNSGGNGSGTNGGTFTQFNLPLGRIMGAGFVWTSTKYCSSISGRRASERRRSGERAPARTSDTG